MGHINGDDDGVGYGVRGRSAGNTTGVRGLTGNAVFDPDVDPGNVAVFGKGSDESYAGVYGKSEAQAGVYGDSVRGMGVYGTCPRGIGMKGETELGIGVWGLSESEDSSAVIGDSLWGTGVSGSTYDGDGVYGHSLWGIGVHGESSEGIGVSGLSDKNAGVHGISNGGGAAGVRAWGFGSAGVASLSDDTAGVWLGNFSAGEFWGDVNIYGNLTSGTKGFKIDHPLDPSNKYLYHSSVESPDMKNVYDGVVVLDAKGEAVVVLAAWFEALNKDFRYQLTPIGAPGPNLHLAEEIKNQRFKIAGGSSGMKVCWQVTGIRHDALAQANPLVVEQDKLANERDHYLHPEAHGYPAQKSMVEVRHPEELGQFRKEQQKIT